MTNRRRPGRPSKYSGRLVREICLRIACGDSLRAVCEDDRMPHKATVLRWLLDPRRDDFRRRYAAAREAQADALADELVDIADAARDRDEAAVAKLRIEARKWVAAKLRPRKYGDKLDLSGSVDVRHEDALLALDEAASGSDAGSDANSDHISDDGDERS